MEKNSTHHIHVQVGNNIHTISCGDFITLEDLGKVIYEICTFEQHKEVHNANV